MGISNFVRSKIFKNFMSKLYGWGASMVIAGALFKINHYPGAEYMLILGMGTEVVIFFFSAFEPQEVKPDWSLVYPELAGFYHYDIDENEIAEPGSSVAKKEGGGGDATSQELDKMLEEAKIGPDLVQSLGEGMRKLSDNVANLNEMTSVAETTNNYVKNMDNASQSVNQLVETYQKSTQMLEQSSQQVQQSLSAFDFSDVDTNAYKDQIKKVSENLSALNSAYELQLQTTKEQTDANSKLKENMDQLNQNLSESAKQTENYQQTAANLTENVAKLNEVYGNMLAAMNVQKG